MTELNFSDDNLYNREMWLCLYYYIIENLSISDTAKLLGIHRLKVSRNITKAKEKKLFKLLMHPPKEIELEGKLRKRFRLKDCRIVPIESDNPDTINRAIGEAAAKYFEEQVNIFKNENQGQKVKVGIAGGVTVEKVIDALMPNELSGLEIYPLVGGPLAQNAVAAGALVDRMASKCKASTRYEIVRFHPVTNEEKETILSLKYVAEVLERIKTVNFAIVGIGNLSETSTLGSTVNSLGLDIENLRKAGACGDICSILLSSDGKILENKVINLLVGISAEGLKEISNKNGGRVIGVSGGIEKAKAIAAALLGGTDGKEPWVDTIITDEKTGARVLDIV